MKIGELGMIASRSPVEVDYEFFFTYMYTRIKRIGKNNSLRVVEIRGGKSFNEPSVGARVELKNWENNRG